MKYDYFEPTSEIDSYIHSLDMEALRGILVGIINRDPTFATTRYAEAVDYICKQKGGCIWDSPKKLAGEYELPIDKWNKDYYHRLLAWFSQNFTKEREEYIKKVGKHVYKGEYTWGKDEAKNFPCPDTQLNGSTMPKGQGVTGIIMLALFMTLAIVAVILLVQISVIVKCLLLLMIIIINTFLFTHRKNSSGKDSKK